MLGHSRLSGMHGCHQQIMTAAVDETTFKPGKDLAFKERLGLKWKSVLQLILTSVVERSVTPPLSCAGSPGVPARIRWRTVSSVNRNH
jgi:hypothetical protein